MSIAFSQETNISKLILIDNIFFIAKETNIPKLVLIDNCFPDLIETSTFISYDVQQMLSIGKLKSISMTDTVYFVLHL